MAFSKPIPVFHKQQIDVLSFSVEFNDLSPVDELRGPKTPSNRQSLRHFLHWISQGKSLDEAGAEVAVRVIAKHPTVPASKLKAPRTLSDNVVALYREARFTLSNDMMNVCKNTSLSVCP